MNPMMMGGGIMGMGGMGMDDPVLAGTMPPAEQPGGVTPEELATLDPVLLQLLGLNPLVTADTAGPTGSPGGASPLLAALLGGGMGGQMPPMPVQGPMGPPMPAGQQPPRY